jgi:hypothetical protein
MLYFIIQQNFQHKQLITLILCKLYCTWRNDKYEEWWASLNQNKFGGGGGRYQQNKMDELLENGAWIKCYVF